MGDKEKRNREFRQLFDSLPARVGERVERIAAMLLCSPQTVHIWRMENTARVIPPLELSILKRNVRILRKELANIEAKRNERV